MSQGPEVLVVEKGGNSSGRDVYPGLRVAESAELISPSQPGTGNTEQDIPGQLSLKSLRDTSPHVRMSALGQL